MPEAPTLTDQIVDKLFDMSETDIRISREDQDIIRWQNASGEQVRLLRLGQIGVNVLEVTNCDDLVIRSDITLFTGKGIVRTAFVCTPVSEYDEHKANLFASALNDEMCSREASDQDQESMFATLTELTIVT